MSVASNPAISPLRLAPDYRDYFGAAHEHLVETIEAIVNADAFRLRVFHVPDSATEVAGVPANGHLEYALELPPGSIILGFLHSNTPVPDPWSSGDASDPPVGSSFRCQIQDVDRNYRFFQKPVPEAYFLNDLPTYNPLGPYAGNNLYCLNPSLRLLMAPYPVAPPGQFKVEFWNIYAPTGTPTANTLISLDFVVAEPDPASSGTASQGGV
jgi:hypothetical protein